MSSLNAYGVVQINDIHLAIVADALMEAVHWPTDLQPHPLTRGALLGVFTLRGKPVPLVDLRGQLADSVATAEPTPLVAILKYDGGFLGLAIDAVCDILKAPDSRFYPMGPGGQNAGLLPALMLGTETSRLIYKLDLACLAALPGVLFAADPSARLRSEEALAAQHRLLHYLVFECDGRHFCIDASVVTELVDQPDISPSDFASDCCFGVTLVRGTKVPALNLSQVLGLDHQPQPSKPQLLLLTAPDGRVCGFGYDRMVAIHRQDPEQMLAVPAYGLPHPELLAGVMNLQDGEQALLLDHPSLLQRPEVKSYTQVYQHDVKPAQASHEVTRTMLRHACLLFDAPTRFVAPLSQIVEILSVPEQLIGLSQPSTHLLGQFNLRGEQVPLICLSSLLEEAPHAQSEASRVLIVRGDRLCFGFAVGCVDSIDAFNQFDPAMLDKGWQTNIGKDISVNDRVRSLVSVGSPERSWRATLLDLQGLARQLERDVDQRQSARANDGRPAMA
ncbi:chemotaxis protein CheW [Pseudomonas sp. CDFA 602]|uniref:chemotaxis protein CheW n=1 Tax=Pseudomonas californiensis TaxID=2829823 RepID=UPI001E65DA15|nr:chemotaxis protein CheW [Pseudomonas californiensis]MCD5993459.1 chemotaxis protein CheW [Pseudomonas californiensis]MCD5999054.1 chemotaxis protein CheW [Pseudomonas californiensis]